MEQYLLSFRTSPIGSRFHSDHFPRLRGYLCYDGMYHEPTVRWSWREPALIIKPRVRGFICTTAHPEGCAQHVREEIATVQSQPSFHGPKNVLVIGASTGYGLSSRIAAAFGAGAHSLGVSFEKPAAEGKTATAGWYNTAAFEREAQKAGLLAQSLNGDAFSNEVKRQAIDRIRRDFGKIDLVVYSLASPRRTHPLTGETFWSVIKPVGRPFTGKTVDVHSGVISEVTLEPATEEEIRHTVAVMGGEDWQLWIDALDEAGVLADRATTLAYSYIGPEVTHAMYREGTIGRAKDHLESTAAHLNESLAKKGGQALISINKAVVTQSSSAIPVVPLYISLVFKVMKEQGMHEGCVEQMVRLFAHRLYAGSSVPVDDSGRIRLDDLEMLSNVQKEVTARWKKVSTENLGALSDIEGYREEFLRLFGFGYANVDYEADVDPEWSIPSLQGASSGI